MSPRTARVCILVSAVILLTELFNLLVWMYAARSGVTQQESVSIYLNRLPFGIGGMGITSVTWTLAALAVIGGALALFARSAIPNRRMASSLAGAHGVVALWLVFTMM